MRPRWRWALFCVALEAHRILRWGWLSDLWAWCILPEWVATDEELANPGAPNDNPPF